MNDAPGDLDRVSRAADDLACALREPALLISLHRDLTDLGYAWGQTPNKKKAALRWGIFTMTYAATEAFFREALDPARELRSLPIHPDKLRAAGDKRGVRVFRQEWAVRTRAKGSNPNQGDRSRWMVFAGVESLRAYLGDMKRLRDLLSHGGDPFAVTNESGALWVRNKGNSMTLMGAEGFFQACTDLAAQTVLAFGGRLEELPEWPEPRRSGLSAEPMPAIALLPGARVG